MVMCLGRRWSCSSEFLGTYMILGLVWAVLIRGRVGSKVLRQRALTRATLDSIFFNDPVSDHNGEYSFPCQE